MLRNIFLTLAAIFIVPALFSLNAEAAVIEVSASQSRPFKSKISRAMAEEAAASAARIQALQLAEREVAALDDFRLLYGSSAISFRPRPEPAALALALFYESIDAVDVWGTPPDMQVTVSLRLILDIDEKERQRMAMIASHPLRLDFYAEALSQELEALKEYDSAASFFLQGVSPAMPEEDNRRAHEAGRAFNALDAARAYIALLPAIIEVEELARAGKINGKPARNAVSDLAEKLLAQSSKSPAHYPVWTDLAYMQMLRNNFDQAGYALGQALQQNPDFVPALNLRGLLMFAKELPALGLADFNRAIELAPHHAELFENRGMSYMVMQHYPEMCTDFVQACSLGECGALDWARVENMCLQEEK